MVVDHDVGLVVVLSDLGRAFADLDLDTVWTAHDGGGTLVEPAVGARNEGTKDAENCSHADRERPPGASTAGRHVAGRLATRSSAIRPPPPTVIVSTVEGSQDGNFIEPADQVSPCPDQPMSFRLSMQWILCARCGL